ncbi:FCD domain-containing protein [Trinickia sp. Y13]|uniref:phage integrase central domain-containing protein n=1 Tax=Trinickia sp. Y13 TaxID=2917807 RepID=UPI0024049165|nr:FCD domain-containing protein [Trinickia sp. Y13]MDG0026654.1 FCD domain-containing protein [Trinickia sp. Y13]
MFSQAVDYIARHKGSWKNKKYAQQWENTLATYAYPIIDKADVRDVDTPKLGRDHDELIDAIARKDADAAERAAHEHTMLFQKRFLDYMRQNMTESLAIL